MRQARELLREYLERRPSSAATGASDALREENLRRLLRHVGAAQQPSEQFESRLLQAMRETGAEMTARRSPGSRGASAWSRPLRPAWQIWAPATALAIGALVFAAQIRHTHDRTKVVSLPPAPHPQIRHTPRSPVHVAELHPLIGHVLMGALLVQHAPEEPWQPVGSGAEIHLDDTVKTDADADGSILFLDSSLCRVRPNSTLSYTAATRTGLRRPSLLLLARGETWNVVQKGGPAFMVATPSATATVRGTEFGVAVDAAGKTTLRVKQGKVELQAAQATVLVPAGMQTAALPGHAPQIPVLMVAASKPRPKGTPPPGTLHVIPTAAGSAAGAATGGSSHTFRLSPRSTLQPAAPAGAAPPSTPTDSSGAPTSSSSDGGAEPRLPVSTSP